jgi:hypothetical protein
MDPARRLPRPPGWPPPAWESPPASPPTSSVPAAPLRRAVTRTGSQRRGRPGRPRSRTTATPRRVRGVAAPRPAACQVFVPGRVVAVRRWGARSGRDRATSPPHRSPALYEILTGRCRTVWPSGTLRGKRPPTDAFKADNTTPVAVSGLAAARTLRQGGTSVEIVGACMPHSRDGRPAHTFRRQRRLAPLHAVRACAAPPQWPTAAATRTPARPSRRPRATSQPRRTMPTGRSTASRPPPACGHVAPYPVARRRPSR